MRVEPLVEDWIVAVHGFFDAPRCAAEIARATAAGFAGATLADGLRHEEVRDNDRAMFDDPALADDLWARIRPHAPRVDGVAGCGLNERFRVYRYVPGQRFRPHTDGRFRRPGEESRLTFMVYLNGDLEGGATRFGRFEVAPELGKALLFRHEIEHEGCPVVAGTKWVLRSDVMFRSADFSAFAR